MSVNIEKLSESMFPAEGTRVLNVKFFPGHNRAVTAQELADQLDRADAQIRSGTALRSSKLDGHLTVNKL